MWPGLWNFKKSVTKVDRQKDNLNVAKKDTHRVQPLVLFRKLFSIQVVHQGLTLKKEEGFLSKRKGKKTTVQRICVTMNQ